MIGQDLDGRYRILAKLGEGAMGEVYLVEHQQLRRKEALKVLRPSRSDEELVSRFRREARATNRLQHPNIVSVYDFGRLPDGRFYLTTEYADGENLHLLLGRVGRFPLRRAVSVLTQLADAVDHAHSRGVIHRDLKPANLILVERRGHADLLKVLDFGVAKIIAPDYQDSLAQTREGQVLGTPAYLAPEQVKGQGDDPRIDLYAIGCVGYELVSGAPPFGGSSMEVIGGHLTKTPVRLREHLSDVTPELEEIIFRCLEKDPNRRFPTAAALAVALRGLPAYVEEESSAGRRSYRSIPAEILARVNDPNRDPTAFAETMHGESLETTVYEPRGWEEAKRAHQVALRDLAEAIIDRGRSDYKVTAVAASIAALEGQIDRIDVDTARLDEDEDRVEQRRREQEASLRFAIGELRFECDEARAAGRPVDPDVEHQLSELENSLAKMAEAIENELEAITERAIALVADRAVKVDELDVAYQRLEEEVEANLPAVADPHIESLRDRLAEARVGMEMAVRDG